MKPLNVFKAFVVFLLSGILLACTSLPDDVEIEEIFTQHKLSDGFGDLFSVQAFKKTNGFHKSDNVYIVDVEYDLKFKKGLGDVLEEISEDPVGPQYGVFGSKFIAYTIKANYGNFSAGDRIHREEKITLIKTEQGWQLESG